MNDTSKRFKKPIDHLINYMRSNNINQDHFIVHHDLLPFYLEMKALMNVKEIENTMLLQSYQFHIYHAMKLIGEAMKIQQHLAKHRIKCLHLKGPVLASLLFSDSFKRFSSDNDILVKFEDLAKIDLMLYQLGYEKKDYFSTKIKGWKSKHHHFNYYNHDGIKVEVHWKLNPGHIEDPDFIDLWRERQTVQLNNVNFATLGNEDLLHFLVMHGSRHCWSRLKWLLDIHQLSNFPINWNEVNLKLKKHAFLLQVTYELADIYFGTKRPFQIGEDKNKKRFELMLMNSQYIINDQIDIRDPRNKLERNAVKDFQRCTRTFSEDIKTKSEWILPLDEEVQYIDFNSHLHFMYYAGKPLFWMIRKYRNR